jgi:hypothetical protein
MKYEDSGCTFQWRVILSKSRQLTVRGVLSSGSILPPSVPSTPTQMLFQWLLVVTLLHASIFLQIQLLPNNLFTYIMPAITNLLQISIWWLLNFSCNPLITDYVESQNSLCSGANSFEIFNLYVAYTFAVKIKI